MLKHPFLDIPYAPKLQYFLGGFDIYDREDSLGAAIATYNINITADRAYLINKLVVERSTDLNHRHKQSLINVLRAALDDDEYDFSKVLRPDPKSYCGLPCGWEHMDNPRGFFE